MKVLVGAFNHEKALVGAFSVILKTNCESNGSFYSTRLVYRCILTVSEVLHAAGLLRPGAPHHRVEPLQLLLQPARLLVLRVCNGTWVTTGVRIFEM